MHWNHAPPTSWAKRQLAAWRAAQPVRMRARKEKPSRGCAGIAASLAAEEVARPADLDEKPGSVLQPAGSLDFTQVVLHLRGSEHAENAVLANDADLNVVFGDRPLETLLERQNCGVNCVLNLDVITIPLLQEGLRVDVVLADGRRLPAEEGTRRVHLVKLRAVVIVPRDHQTNAEGAYASRLGELLHDSRNFAHELSNRHRLFVDALVLGCVLPSLVQDHPKIWDHAREHNTHGFRVMLNLLEARVVHKNGLHLLLRGENDAILRANPERRASSSHCVQGILDLMKLPRRRERRETK